MLFRLLPPGSPSSPNQLCFICVLFAAVLSRVAFVAAGPPLWKSLNAPSKQDQSSSSNLEGLAIGVYNGEWLTLNKVAEGVAGNLFVCIGAFRCFGYSYSHAKIPGPNHAVHGGLITQVSAQVLQQGSKTQLDPGYYKPLGTKLQYSQMRIEIHQNGLYEHLKDIVSLEKETKITIDTDEAYILAATTYLLSIPGFVIPEHCDQTKIKKVMAELRQERSKA